MILKKPYAFLIKHFRLIHLIITAMFGYVALKNREIYLFLKKVIANTTNRYDAPMYINYRLFIYIILALIFCFLVQWLLKYKDKPRKLYKITIFIYGLIIVFMLILFNYMGGFASTAIEQKTIRLYRDILTIALLFQYYIVFVMLIRGLGFDIKKFDFNRDVRELNLEASDSEEVEVSTHVDTTNVVRMVRKSKRELGYFFQEFKVYIIIILIITLGIIGYRGYKYFSVKYKIYNENEYFGAENIILINKSYHIINSNNEYVVIDFDIYRYGSKKQFNINDMVIEIGDNKYIANKNICYKFNDLGNCYKKQYITNEDSNYILVYEISELKEEESYLIYTDTYGEKYKVKLNLDEY